MPSEAGFPAFRRHLKLQNPIHRAVLYVPSCVEASKRRRATPPSDGIAALPCKRTAAADR
ncbi:hypothetical protein [Neisseria polysaccharea]|uniref:hypothetical protein n=1 Tax=Neisseria polysaccharea TaxID=489 RepID=UPI00272D1B37|nr:hypothetical protein [Neisseria polysaccharea]